MLSANSKGLHLIILPGIYIILIPMLLGYYILNPNFNLFYQNLGIVLATLLMIWNGLELYLVFILRKTNPKKSQYALDSRQIIKYAIYMSIIFLVMAIVFDNLITQKIITVSGTTIEKSQENLFAFGFGSFFAMLFSIVAYIPILMSRNFSRGQSFLHFQAGLEIKNKVWKISNYLSGVDDYNRYLGEVLGIKFKHIDKIHSSITAENISSLDSKIRELLESFNDPIRPAKILSSRTEHKPEEFFQEIKPYEHLEKWIKYFAPLIPIITVSITLYFQHIQSNGA